MTDAASQQSGKLQLLAIMFIVTVCIPAIGATPCFKLKDWKNPCLNATCANNAQCVPAMNTNSHKCVCLQDCWDVGDSDDSGPVCGSDAVDYESICHLRRASCHAAVNVQMRYKGRCDPCQNHICKATMKCRIDEYRRPYCDCKECLTRVGDVVCGTDGKTYGDECQLRYESCRHSLKVTKLYDGKCRSGAHCSKPCPHPYMLCRVKPTSKTLESECICPTECPPILSRVCGTDGNVYDSVCELRRAACQQRRLVWPLLYGDCGTSGACRLPQQRCPNGGLCRMRIDLNSHGSYDLMRLCERPQCVLDAFALRADLRVCGSDGVTYKSECYLRQRAFDTGTEIFVQSKGSCDPCAGVICPHYGLCRVAADGTATCQCQNNCLYVYRPVCGSDGMTYDLECDLRLHACRKQKDIRILHQGPCNSTTSAPPEEEANSANANNYGGDNDASDSTDVGGFWTDP